MTLIKHPARFSIEIIEEVAKILNLRYRHTSSKPIIFDCYGGSGERLRLLGDRTGMTVRGVEIEPKFIIDPCVTVGDAQDPSVYPDERHIIFTSPTYPNGMADAHQINDTSRRYTYTAALGHLPNVNSQARYGYRSTRRNGKSRKRQKYWEIANNTVKNWGNAEMIIVNVSDFYATRGGATELEPVVADWSDLLAKHGYPMQALIPVKTPRMKNGANRDVRVGHEVLIVTERNPQVTYAS